MSLQGTLSTLGITEVLEFLASRSSNGQLDITTTSGTASYLLVNGTIGIAEYEFVRGSGENPAEATYYVLAEMDGEFFFDDHPVEGAEEGVDVPTLLGDTAEIAERWLAVEEGIPTTSHVLSRNSELDASVTIKPEWWKVLEVLGQGKSSAELSSLLDLSILDTSTQALDMVDAGLLTVGDPAAEAAADPVVEEIEPEAAPEEMAVTEHVAPEAVEPVAEASPAETAAPVTEPAAAEAVEEAPATAEQAEPSVPTFSNPMPGDSEPVMATEEAIAQAPAPPIMGTPEPVAEAAPAAAEQAPADSGVVLGFSKHLDDEPATDDDGWSTNAFYQDPSLATAPVEEAAPAVVEAAPMAIEETPAPMAFEETPAPMAFEETPAPMSFDETPAPMGFDSSFPEPAAEPAAAAPDQFDSSSLYGLDAPFSEAPAAESDAMASEVMEDLAFLNDDLDSQMPEQNWQMDPTPEPMPAAAPQVSAPAQASPAQASPIPAASTTGLGDADPFGSLSDLVVDDEPEGDEDRGSVLKFLRRD